MVQEGNCIPQTPTEGQGGGSAANTAIGGVREDYVQRGGIGHSVGRSAKRGTG